MPSHAPMPFSFTALLVLIIALHNSIVGQTPQKMEPRRLEPGVVIAQTFSRNEEHQYQFALTQGQCVRIQVEKQGIFLISTLSDPAGTRLIRANFEGREHGIEKLLLVAQTTGLYTLSVRPEIGRPQNNRYEVRIDEPHTTSETDQQEFVAQQLFAEGYRLFNEGTDTGRRAAIPKFAAALIIWRSLNERWWEAKTLLQMGSVEYWLQAYDDALSHFTQSLELRRASKDIFGESEALAAIGGVHISQREFQKAIDHLNQALVLQQTLEERWHAAGTFFYLAKAYGGSYDIKKEMQCYLQALQMYQEAGDKSNEAVAHADLANMQLRMGDLQAALDHSQKALALYRNVKIPYVEAVALHHLGNIHNALGEYERALDYFRQALAICRAIGEYYGMTHVLKGMGISYNALGQQQQALNYFGQALSNCRRMKDQRGESSILSYIGRTYREIGQLPPAIKHLNQGLQLSQQINDLSNQVTSLTSLGEVYADLGKYEQAITHLKMALPIEQKISNRQSEARTLYVLARVERDQGNLVAARAHIEAALQIIESLRAKVIGAELRSSFLAAQQGSYELYIDLLMQLHEQAPNAGHDAHALQVSEQARARVLLESLVEARAEIRQGGEASLLEREQALQKQLNAQDERRLRLLSGKHTAEQAAAAERAVETVLAEFQRVQAQIRASSPRYAALTQPQPLSLARMQAQLDGDTLLLVYSLGTQHSFLWAVTPTTVKSYVLPAREKIRPLVERVYQLLPISHQRASGAAANLATEQLSRLLLAPLKGQLTKRRLVIVADGVLQYIPFAALFAPSSTERLTAKHEIAHLPSVSALSQLRQDLAGRKPAPQMMAMIADPVFEMADKRFLATDKRPAATAPSPTRSLTTVTRAAEGIGRAGFTRLRYSEQEAEQITRLIPAAQQTKLLGFDASRAALNATDLSQYQMLHFATHSVIHPKTPELSGIVLSLYDRERNPQNGFLQAHEIYNLKLNADLVVLSACQTAIGKEVRGEGLISLSRGFMYAGAPRLVVSLWKVDDNATAELMQRFYRGMLKDNLRPAAALRTAQSSMAREPRWAAPYYWAGFVLQGEWK